MANGQDWYIKMPQANNTKPAGSLKTTWDVATYDVWGNAKDGYEVNDVYRHAAVELRVPITRYNVDSPHEFKSAYPTDKQLRKVFGVSCHIETDGDDLHVTVNRKRDGYPIGELQCTSHESLSPIRAKAKVAKGENAQ